MANRELKDIVNSKYVSAYASLSSAVSAIGSTPTVLRINESETVSATLTLPPTLKLEFDGSSVISVNSGQILTLGNVPEGVQRKIFSGAGQVRFAKTVGDGNFLASWWIDDGTVTPVTITEAQWTGMRYALYNNSAGTLIFPAGEYNYTYTPTLQIARVKGAGQTPNIDGTVLIQQTNGQPCLKAIPSGRSMHIEDIVLSADGLSTGGCFLAEGASGDASIVGLFFNNVTMDGGAYGLKFNDTHANQNWQVTECELSRSTTIVGQTVACIVANSVNASFKSDATLTPGHGAWAAILDGVGRAEFNGTVNGRTAGSISPGYTATLQYTFDSGDVDTGANTIDLGTTDLVKSDPLRFSNSGGALPTGISAGVKYYWNDSGTLHYNTVDSEAGTNPVDITTGGSGTHTAVSTRPNTDAAVLAAQPLGGVKVTGPFTEGIYFGPMYRDEGIPWWIYVDDGAVDASISRMYPLDFCGGESQGQAYFGDNALDVNLRGGWLLADSLHDNIGGAVRVKDFGTRLYRYAGNISSYAGFAVPSPYTKANFIGYSHMERGDDFAEGTIHARSSNDLPISGWGLKGTSSNEILTLVMQRIGSGVKAGWWYLKNSLFGVQDAQAGLYTDGGFGYHGRLLNTRGDAATGTSGTITLNLSLGNEFTVTPSGDATIEFSNGPASHYTEVTLWVTTSGTTSRNLTQGTNVVMQKGGFATGTTSGARFALKFKWDGTYLIETGRGKPDALAATATADVIEVRGSSSAIKLYDRAGQTGQVTLYSATDGVAAFYYGGSDVLKVDQSSTATHTRLFIWDVDNATLERVTVGAADSGGTGFKVLRIPN